MITISLLPLVSLALFLSASISYECMTHKKQTKLTEVNKKMEIKVEAPKRIEDGKHEGVIVEVRYRETPYAYTDFVIEFDEGKKVITGVPTALTPESKLGRILLDFGASLEVGESIDPETVLVGKKCSFMTMTKTSDRGSFANVVQGSLRPRE